MDEGLFELIGTVCERWPEIYAGTAVVGQGVTIYAVADRAGLVDEVRIALGGRDMEIGWVTVPGARLNFEP